MTRLIEEGDVVVAEGTVRNALSDGGVLCLVFCDVFLMRGGQIPAPDVLPDARTAASKSPEPSVPVVAQTSSRPKTARTLTRIEGSSSTSM